MSPKAKKKKAKKVAPKSKSKIKKSKTTTTSSKTAKSKSKAGATGANAKAKARRKKGGLSLVYLGLGSNVGEREEYIEQAIFLLGKVKGITVMKRAANFETEAEGVEDQPPFLNAAVEIETTLSPHKLLEATQEIETSLGRERGAEWGPRTIDIDILLYDDQIISEDKLQIPHPLLHERVFVLKPLMELAPDALHPTLEKTISELYEDIKSEGNSTYDDALPGFKEIKQGAPDDYERW
jgi:2-amino-4-hydroxy-6-hydroxymethyldihydropteridine diphosphokinase